MQSRRGSSPLSTAAALGTVLCQVAEPDEATVPSSNEQAYIAANCPLQRLSLAGQLEGECFLFCVKYKDTVGRVCTSDHGLSTHNAVCARGA